MIIALLAFGAYLFIRPEALTDMWTYIGGAVGLIMYFLFRWNRRQG